MRVKQRMIDTGGLSGKSTTYERVIDVPDGSEVPGEVVDSKTKVSDWTPVVPKDGDD